jgi:hypothetical protein
MSLAGGMVKWGAALEIWRISLSVTATTTSVVLTRNAKTPTACRYFRDRIRTLSFSDRAA